WSFLTHGRGSRLITGEPLLPPITDPEPPSGGPAPSGRVADGASASATSSPTTPATPTPAPAEPSRSRS
ncbi:MAG TPA: hypothetical protein VID95_08450, partial [Candidatus Limnocylindrales bacterium]